MGLLDFNMPGIDTPQGQGLLAAAFSLMGAKGNSMAEAIGDAGNKYMGVYQQARSLEDQKAMRDLQMKQAQLQLDEQQRAIDDRNWMRTTAQKYTKPAGVKTTMEPVNAPGDYGPNLFSNSVSNMTKPVETPTPASFDINGFMNEYMQRDPFDATAKMRDLTKPDWTPVAEGTVMLGRDGKPVFTNPKQQAPSDVSRLMTEMMALPPNDPRRAVLMQAIQKATTHAPATTLTVPVNTEKTLWGNIADTVGGVFKDKRAAAEAGVATIRDMQELNKTFKNGIVSGFGANERLQLVKALNFTGVNVDQNQIGNTEYFNSIVKGLVTERVKALGANPSNSDVRFILETLPSIDRSPQAIPMIIQRLDKLARDSINTYNEGFAKPMMNSPNAKAFPFSIMIDAPQIDTQTTGGVAPPMSAQAAAAAELARRRGR